MCLEARSLQHTIGGLSQWSGTDAQARLWLVGGLDASFPHGAFPLSLPDAEFQP